MQYIYHKDAKNHLIDIVDDYKYLFKVRRKKLNDIIRVRNLEDDFLYFYKVISIDRKKATLELVSKEKNIVKPSKFIHISWCIVDIKTIEKTLPCLNEMGVSKISFVYCKYSQKNFKLNLERIKKILINSNIQCGRVDLMEIEIFDSIDSFLKQYPDTIMFNFSSDTIDKANSNILIGPEGGFSEDEIKKFKVIKGIDSNLILRSESAVCFIASRFY